MFLTHILLFPLSLPRSSPSFGPGASDRGLISNCREIVGQLIRILTGHAFLKRHNAVIFHGISPPPGDVSCRFCIDPFSEETPHHIITECEYLHVSRYETMGALLLDEFPDWKPTNLMKFLRHKDIILLETE